MRSETRELILAAPALPPAAALVVVTRVLLPVPSRQTGRAVISRHGRSLRQARSSRVNAGALVLAVAGLLAAFGAGRWQRPSDERSYSLRIALPPIAPVASPRIGPIQGLGLASPLVIRHPGLVLPMPGTRTPGMPLRDELGVPAAKTVADDRATVGQAPLGQLLRINGLKQVRAAAMESLRTGIAVPWAAAGIEGFAVAGPAQVTGNHVCRYAAIWAEIGAQGGKSLPQRYCLNEQGKWMEVGVGQSVQAFDFENGGNHERSQSSTGAGNPAVQDLVGSDGIAEQPQ